MIAGYITSNRVNKNLFGRYTDSSKDLLLKVHTAVTSSIRSLSYDTRTRRGPTAKSHDQVDGNVVLT